MYLQEHLFARAKIMGYHVWKDGSGSYAVSCYNIDVIGLQCVSANRKLETLTWLQEHLEKTKDSKWHIILCHAPLLAHNPHRNDGSAYYRGNEELQRILDSHEHIIFVSGHTHFSPNTCQENVEYIPERHTIYIADGSIVPTELAGEPLMPSEWHDGVIAELLIFDHVIEIGYHSIHTGKMFPRGVLLFGVSDYEYSALLYAHRRRHFAMCQQEFADFVCEASANSIFVCAERKKSGKGLILEKPGNIILLNRDLLNRDLIILSKSPASIVISNKQ